LQGSQTNSFAGEKLRPQEFVRSPLKKQNEFPSAEDIERMKPPAPRSLVLSAEEFYQWRQVLGHFKKDVTKTIHK
jgi:hypothetical protein